jgi:1,4-dihydroxy-2-naphthoyl-CoA synthase
MEKQLIEEISDGVATLTFYRPDRLNAFSTPIMEGLLEALPRLARDAAVAVIVPAWWGREYALRRCSPSSCAPLSWASTNSARRPQTNPH